MTLVELACHLRSWHNFVGLKRNLIVQPWIPWVRCSYPASTSSIQVFMIRPSDGILSQQIRSGSTVKHGSYYTLCLALCNLKSALADICLSELRCQHQVRPHRGWGGISQIKKKVLCQKSEYWLLPIPPVNLVLELRLRCTMKGVLKLQCFKFLAVQHVSWARSSVNTWIKSGTWRVIRRCCVD